MYEIKNNRKITITCEGLTIQPFGTIKIDDKDWSGIYGKTIRDCVFCGYLTIKKVEDKKVRSKEKGIE